MDTQAPNKTQTKETFKRKINNLILGGVRPVRKTNPKVKYFIIVSLWLPVSVSVVLASHLTSPLY